MSINTCRVLIAAFLLSSLIAIDSVFSINVNDNNLLLPVSSFSHFCNNGYASIQNKLDILKNTRKTPNSNSNDATMSTIPQQQYDVTKTITLYHKNEYSTTTKNSGKLTK